MITIKFTRYYYKKCTNIQDSNFFKTLPKLSSESKEHCEGCIRNDECLEVLKDMKFNKSPGNDGLTVEFYNTFWPIVGGIVIDVLNEAYALGELSSSQKQAVITLIAKEGKDSLLLKNYRPISLLNVDYKILAKILAKRIKEVLNEVILGDQVGYMKERYIGEAIRIIDDMIFYTSHNNLPGFLLAIDFEKAFDSVSRDFLQKTLSSFGFGPSFQNWIKVMYTNTISCIMNDGNSTGYFALERGVRQGDPLSPYLFILCIEIIAHKIRNDNSVQGIRFGDCEVKQVLYADDMTIFVANKESIRRVESIFADFEMLSGLRVNRDKTKILGLGSCHQAVCDFSFGKLVKIVKVLGVFFSLDENIKEKMNYKEILSKIKRLLIWWKQRDLTLMGKIQLLKVHIFSKMIYVASITPVPRWVYDSLDELVYDFIWRGKYKIKKETMFLDYKRGGLKMMNFNWLVKAQRVIWVKRLLNDKDLKWKQYFDFETRTLGGRFIFSCDYLLSLLNVSLPKFYLDLLEVWKDTKNFRKVYKHGSYSGNVVLSNNKYIRVEGKCVFDGDLHKKGVYRLKHIVDNDGQLKTDIYFLNLGLNPRELAVIQKIYNHLHWSWKRFMLKEDRGVKETNFIIGKGTVDISKISSKQIYLQFLRSNEYEPSVIARLGRQFDFSLKEIENIFLRLRWCTLNSRLREFQFKLLYGIVYTNHHLFRFKFVSDNLCSFCGKEEETYKHIFYTCVYAQTIWGNCNSLMEDVDLKDGGWEDIMFGSQEPLKGKDQLLNHLIILVKYLIFTSRERKTPPTFTEIKNKLKEDRVEEMKLASVRNSMGIHVSKWENLAID